MGKIVLSLLVILVSSIVNAKDKIRDQHQIGFSFVLANDVGFMAFYKFKLKPVFGLTKSYLRNFAYNEQYTQSLSESGSLNGKFQTLALGSTYQGFFNRQNYLDLGVDIRKLSMAATLKESQTLYIGQISRYDLRVLLGYGWQINQVLIAGLGFNLGANLASYQELEFENEDLSSIWETYIKNPFLFHLNLSWSLY